MGKYPESKSSPREAPQSPTQACLKKPCYRQQREEACIRRRIEAEEKRAREQEAATCIQRLYKVYSQDNDKKPDDIKAKLVEVVPKKENAGEGDEMTPNLSGK